MNNVALVSGSFDPITKGHMYVIDKALDIADEVVVVLATNPDKKYMFSEKQRYQMILDSLHEDFELCLADMRLSVHCLPPEMLLVEYGKQIAANFIVRGIRTTTDFEYENQTNLVQKCLSNMETYYVMPPRNLLEVSSSLIRSCMGLKDWRKIVKDYVSVSVFKELEKVGK